MFLFGSYKHLHTHCNICVCLIYINTSSDSAQVQGPWVHFSDGQKEDFEHLILATGYRLSLPFLDSKQLSALSFQASDSLQPLLLAQHLWHPELPHMAFAPGSF